MTIMTLKDMLTPTYVQVLGALSDWLGKYDLLDVVLRTAALRLPTVHKWEHEVSH
jgi:hypothetical protein